MQDVIGTAIGGKDAGLVFEGDRRFNIVVRLADTVRGDVEALKNLPVPLPASQAGQARASTGVPAGPAPAGSTSVPLRQLASFTFTEGPNQVSRENGRRRVVVTANVRGRDIGSLVAEAQERIAAEVKLPAGYEVRWGGQCENLTAARSRIMDADFAAETANLSRAQILQQAGNAMVAQANQQPQMVLQLLQR